MPPGAYLVDTHVHEDIPLTEIILTPVHQRPSHHALNNCFERGAGSASPSDIYHTDHGSAMGSSQESVQSTLAELAEEVRHFSQQSDTTLAVPENHLDAENYLNRLFQECKGTNIPPRELGVYFSNLRVIGPGPSIRWQPTIASVLNPLSVVSAIQTLCHPSLRDILNSFEGVVRPGEMLLVLGRPGSGCSTLLKTLANQRGQYHAVEGDVYYDSLSPQDIARHYRGDVQYCPEDDVHFPTLTVHETIHFASSTRTPRARADGQKRADYTKLITDIYISMFGLNHAKNTLVGNSSIRGISGGERKRVSISEVLATRSLVSCWDNPTRGLDASTALQFVRALRAGTDMARLCTIASVYQAGEPLFDMFDKVCVLYEGKMAYYGPTNRARQYFIDMGYNPAHRQTTADFLVAVTDPPARIPRHIVGVRPRTAEEFAEHFTRSSLGHRNREDMDWYRIKNVNRQDRALSYRESVLAEHARNVRDRSPYTVSVPMQIRGVTVRRLRIIRGSWKIQLVVIVAFVMPAIIIGSVFLRMSTKTSAFSSRLGVLFFSIFHPTVFSMAEIPALFAQRPIILRHQNAAMYHPFTEALALTLADVPFTFIVTTLYTGVLYPLTGLQQSAGQLFTFFIFVLASFLTMKAFFRSLAAGFGSEAPAQAVAGVSLMALALYTGYSPPIPSLIGALRWIAYINPIRYTFEALVANEFHTLNGTCSQILPSGIGYEDTSLSNQVCTTVGSVPGQATVDGSRFVQMSFGYSQSHMLRNFCIVIVFCIFFVVTLLISTEYNTGVPSQTSVTLFKRGSKAVPVERESSAVGETDEEAQPGGHVNHVHTNRTMNTPAQLNKDPQMLDVFSWRHINYTVTVNRHEQRQLLDDVSGYVAPHKLTALMGESGAGKTTLLNVLAERVGTGVISGDRFVNGRDLPKDFQSQTGYCQQMDVHEPTTTVREAFIFSAIMRQPQNVPTVEKVAYAEECLRMCQLETFASAIVGSLDPERRKRTTVGVELAAKPKLLLFLDEPTSGLDSESARAIMTLLRNLADRGQAILCTIHQPSAEIFEVFDRLLLLGRGGQTVYFGDLGPQSVKLTEYLERNGSRPCKPNENPAEFMLDVIRQDSAATNHLDWHKNWLDSNERQALESEIDKIHAECRNNPPIVATFHGDFPTTWKCQCKMLLQRNFSSYWRTPTYILSKLLLNIIGGLFIGFTFWKTNDTLQGTQNKLFAIFIASILCVPLGCQLQVPFINLRDVYEIREKDSRMYSRSALLTSQILVELPWNILGSVLFFFCWYWTVGFDTSRAGYTFIVYCVLFPIWYTAFAQAVASVALTAEIAGLLFNFCFTFVLTFNGVLQPFSELGWWRWMYYLSPFTYLTEGLLGQAIGNRQIICAPVELSTLDPPFGTTCISYLQPYISSHGGYVNNPDSTSACSFCPSRTTNEFMEASFNISYSHHQRDACLFALYAVLNLALVYILTYLFREWSPARTISYLKEYFSRSNAYTRRGYRRRVKYSVIDSSEGGNPISLRPVDGAPDGVASSYVD